MYTDWKNFYKPYVPAEEYIPDNICSRNLNILAFFAFLGLISSFSLFARVESKDLSVKNPNPITEKIQQIQKNINTTESKNTLLESEALILNHTLTQKLQTKEKEKFSNLSKYTGALKKTGPGIVVQLSDNAKPLADGESPNQGIVHDTYLLAVINDLWAGGAQAVSINNQRITSLSEISCVGPAILVNKTRIVPPFVIKAVGNPGNLFKTIKNGFIQNLDYYGIKYSVDKYEQIEIPADGTIILSGDI